MPVHDWSRVDTNVFHHFHQAWTLAICNTLNAGRLPPGYSALVEQHAGGLVPDVLALEGRSRPSRPTEPVAAVLTVTPPKTSLVRQAKAVLAARGNRIVIRHRLGEVVCALEIVSPGNKSGRAALRAFVEKSIEFLRQGIHLLVLDLLPPTSRDPQGMHKAIWDEIEEEDFTFPEGKNRILASYETGGVRVARVEPVAVGDEMPDMELFLANDFHVMVPLEPTYRATWDASPEEMRIAVETGVLPEPDAE